MEGRGDLLCDTLSDGSRSEKAAQCVAQQRDLLGEANHGDGDGIGGGLGLGGDKPGRRGSGQWNPHCDTVPAGTCHIICVRTRRKHSTESDPHVNGGLSDSDTSLRRLDGNRPTAWGCGGCVWGRGLWAGLVGSLGFTLGFAKSLSLL